MTTRTIETVSKRLNSLFGGGSITVTGNQFKDLVALSLQALNVCKDIYFIKILQDMGIVKNTRLNKGYLTFLDDLEWLINEIDIHDNTNHSIKRDIRDSKYLLSICRELNGWMGFYLNLFENDVSYQTLTKIKFDIMYQTLADYAFGGVARITNTKYFVPMVLPLVCDELISHISNDPKYTQMVSKLSKLSAKFKGMRIYS